MGCIEVTATRVVLAGAHALALSGIRAILDEAPGLTVVGELEGTAEELSAVRRLKPDIVVVDALPRHVGTLDFARTLARLGLPARIRMLILVGGVDERVRELLDTGTTSLLLRDSGTDELLAAIRLVVAGYAVVSDVTDMLDGKAVHRAVASVPDVKLRSLTPREREILSLLARGYGNAEIAARLTVSQSTVKYHTQGVLRKLGVHDRLHAAIYAYEAGLVRPEITP
jgi:DNA-binding NarL/FixJ family response regulator